MVTELSIEELEQQQASVLPRREELLLVVAGAGVGVGCGINAGVGAVVSTGCGGIVAVVGAGAHV